jgi:hypothetical protein
MSQEPVAHACNPSYLGGGDLEDCSSRPAQGISSRDLISKITRVKRTGGVAQAVEHLFCKCKAQSSNPSSAKKKKKISVWKLGMVLHIYNPSI